LQDLIDDDSLVALELLLLASKIRREVCGILNGFFLFFKKYEEDQTYNMSLMLNLRLKSLWLISFLIG